MPATPFPQPAVPTRTASADWRVFAARRYRPFHLLTVAQGLIGALSGAAVVIPLLLALGAHPAVATLIVMLPTAGAVVQRYLPRLLRAVDGNLRGLVILGVSLGEPRGLVLAAIVAAVALGWLPRELAIGLIAIAVAIGGTLGGLSYAVIGSWYQIILPEPERRLVAPRLGGLVLGIGALVLLPLAVVVDGLLLRVGLWAFIIPLVVGGVAGLIEIAALLRLPRPGRVRIPDLTEPGHADADGLREYGRAMIINAFGIGLGPFLSVYALAILHASPGYAIALSATYSGTLVVSSTVVSSMLLRGSAAAILRRSLFVRAGAMLLATAAHPGLGAAPLILAVVAVTLGIGDAAGQLGGAERLFRLARSPALIGHQARIGSRNALAYGAGQLVAAGVMVVGGYVAFAGLFAASGAFRLAAGWRAKARSDAIGTAPEVARA